MPRAWSSRRAPGARPRRRSERADAQDAAEARQAGSTSKHCSQCHGEKGDGKGAGRAAPAAAAARLHAGKFKMRTTPCGALPTDDDLEARGRGWGCRTPRCRPGPQLTDAEVDELVAVREDVLDGLRRPGKAAEADRIPEGPRFAARSRSTKGKELYARIGCAALPRRARPRRRHLGARRSTTTGHADPRRRPDAALDLPRRTDARGHLPHLLDRHERHADAVVLRTR